MASRDQIERIATILARATSDNENEAGKALESAFKRMNRDGVTIQDLLSLPEEKLYQDALVRLADLIVKSRDDLSHPKRRELYSAYLELIVGRFSGKTSYKSTSSNSQQSNSKHEAGQGSASRGSSSKDPFEEWRKQEKARWDQKRREAEEQEKKAQWERERKARENEANRKYREEQEQRERAERQKKEESSRRTKDEHFSSSGTNNHDSDSFWSNPGNTPKQEYTFSFSPAKFQFYLKSLLEPGSFIWCSCRQPGRAIRLLTASLLFGIGFAFIVLLLVSLFIVFTDSRMPFDPKLSSAFAFPAAIGIILRARSLYRSGWFRC